MEFFDTEFQGDFIVALIGLAAFILGAGLQLLFIFISKSKAVQIIPMAVGKLAAFAVNILGAFIVGYAIFIGEPVLIFLGMAVFVLNYLPAAFCFGNAVAWILYAFLLTNRK